MPDLTREHLETFVLDPHAADEDEVKAMARELISARRYVTELKDRLDNGLAANREERIARDELRVMNSDLRARIAELEAKDADLQQRLDLAIAAWHSERDSYRILRDAAEVQS